MTFLTLIAAAYTFTATATGVAKGTPIEFAFVGSGSDRDYEAMFVLDGSVDDFCQGVEKAGLPRGKPENVRSCTMWPVGCTVSIQPPLGDFIETHLTDGLPLENLVYTGGLRLPSGVCDATTNMPMSVLSYYSLSQSPLAFAMHYDQSAVYNCHLAKKELKKGTTVKFTLAWDEKTMPKPLSYTVKPGQSAEMIRKVRELARKDELDLTVDFSPELTVKEAVAVANALAVLDSKRVKINGCAPGHLFYRAFLPAIKWLDRQERLVQPFELTVGATNRLVYVAADWSVEGPDPKLTPQSISFQDAKRKTDTDTCFIYTSATNRLASVYAAMCQLKDSSVRTWYVFEQE